MPRRLPVDAARFCPLPVEPTRPELAYNRVGQTRQYVVNGYSINPGASNPVYVYEFDDRTAPFYFPQMPGFIPSPTTPRYPVSVPALHGDRMESSIRSTHGV